MTLVLLALVLAVIAHGALTTPVPDRATAIAGVALSLAAIICAVLGVASS